MDFKELVKLCKGRHIYIQTHNFPDADAIASAYGLQALFNTFGIESTIFCIGAIYRISTSNLTELYDIKVYLEDDLKDKKKDSDYIICVDSQKNGGNITDTIGDEIACVDHHPKYIEENYKYKYEHIEIVGACATLVARYFKELNIEPSKEVATTLLYGIKMDTLQFTRGVTLEDINMFGYLYERVDIDNLHYLESNSLVFNDLKAYGYAIDNIKVYEDIGFTVIPYSCPDGLIGELSDFLLSLKEVNVSIVFAEREDGIKLSVRSILQKVNAGDLVYNVLKGIGNGGGHACMAGGFIPKNNLNKLGDYAISKLIDMFLNGLQYNK